MIKKIRQQYLQPKQWNGELFKTTIKHNCPNCGHSRNTSIPQGMPQRETICMTCRSTYTLHRSMRTTAQNSSKQTV